MNVKWTEVVYQYLVGPGKGNGGAVCGNDGGVWGRSETMNITFEEVRECWKLFFHQTTISSVVISGVVFTVKEIGEENNIEYIACKSEKYQCGCTLIQTKFGFVVGYYDEPITTRENILATIKLAQNVLDVGC